MIRRWSGLSRRETPNRTGQPAGSERFLAIGFTPAPTDDVDPPGGDGVIACGRLLSDDGVQVLGVAALIEAVDAAAARAALPVHQLVGVEVHRWDFGGRR